MAYREDRGRRPTDLDEDARFEQDWDRDYRQRVQRRARYGGREAYERGYYPPGYPSEEQLDEGYDTEGYYGEDYEQETDYGPDYYRYYSEGPGSGYGRYRGGYGAAWGPGVTGRGGGASSGRGGYRSRQSARYGPGPGRRMDFDVQYGRGQNFDFEANPYGPSGYGQSGPFSGVGPRGYRRSDDRIREDALERLTYHGLIDARDIQVEVNEGEVTLRGTVNRRREKRMAEDVIDQISGVVDVNNELRVRREETERG